MTEVLGNGSNDEKISVMPGLKVVSCCDVIDYYFCTYRNGEKQLNIGTCPSVFLKYMPKCIASSEPEKLTSHEKLSLLITLDV